MIDWQHCLMQKVAVTGSKCFTPPYLFYAGEPCRYISGRYACSYLKAEMRNGEAAIIGFLLKMLPFWLALASMLSE